MRAGDTAQALVWHGTVIRVTTASATDATLADPVNKTGAPLFLAAAALVAFGFLRVPAARTRSRTRRREMTIAQLVHPELVTMLCFGLGLHADGLQRHLGALVLLTGLAVPVLATVRPSVRLVECDREVDPAAWSCTRRRGTAVARFYGREYWTCPGSDPSPQWRAAYVQRL